MTTTGSGSLKLKGSIWDRATWVAARQRGKMGTETPLEHTSLSDRPRVTPSHISLLPGISSCRWYLAQVSHLWSPLAVTQGTRTCHCRFTRLPPLPWPSGSQCWLHISYLKSIQKTLMLGLSPCPIKAKSLGGAHTSGCSSSSSGDSSIQPGFRSTSQHKGLFESRHMLLSQWY